ncbi:MAG: AAA family ATPase [Pseudomonadota bacterium]
MTTQAQETSEIVPDHPPETDQREAIAFLMNAPIEGVDDEVERVETHAGMVFLRGDRAFKIKRAVKYDYLDFTRLDTRERMLRRELELNHRVGPQIYEDVVPITREPDGNLALDGSGVPVEWVLQMARFSNEDEFSRIAARKELTDPLADRLGRATAEYHTHAQPRECDGATLIADIIEELQVAFVTMTQELGPARVDAFNTGCIEALERVSGLLSTRSASGHVRRCHGDLHLSNIVLLEGCPVPFDALEFDEVLGTCDVLYDLAFLVMDLRHQRLERAANMVLNAYLYSERGMEDPGIEAFPLFLAVRGGIRAMICVQTDLACGTPGKSNDEARAYLDEAISALAPPKPRLIAIGGRSGSGKTSLSRKLAPLFGAAPGAVHLRSDLERKAIFCVDPLTRLPADSYTKTVNKHVHERLRIRADTILSTGYSVLLDAVFTTPSERVALADLAQKHGVPFDGLWLKTDASRLLARVSARDGDASDADETVVRLQLGVDAGSIEWTKIDASGSKEDTIALAFEALGFEVPQ